MKRTIFFLVLTSAIVGVCLTPLVLAASYSSITFTVKIPVCGNGSVESGEQCDGSDLGGQSCANRGFSGGTLSCSIGCDFNTAACTTTPGGGNGGGGGGGGGGAAPPPIPSDATVIFSGITHPNVTIVQLQDAVIAAETVSDGAGQFVLQAPNVPAGRYAFALYSFDDEKRRSSLALYDISLLAGAKKIISDIFLSPTVAVDKLEVRPGDTLAVLGQTAPNRKVTILLSGGSWQQSGAVLSDGKGDYRYAVQTTDMPFGDYIAKTFVNDEAGQSALSRAVSFRVGDETVKNPTAVSTARGDANGDLRVNLVDFSIFAYWYKRANPPQTVDLNGDHRVDLTDFSMMAFYWTG